MKSKGFVYQSFTLVENHKNMNHRAIFTMKTCIFLVVVLCSYFRTIAQDSSDSSVWIGGINFKQHQQLVVDNISLGVYYQFAQKAFYEDKTVIILDTLFLGIGSSHSLFLDPYYKEKLEISRKARINRSKKIGRVNMEYNNVSEIEHLINVKSDYQEENNGDPVQIYKNNQTGAVSSVYNAFIDNLICIQQIEEFGQWVITNETDTILNFLCNKAMTTYAGRNYTAWFTQEIPVSDGPWKFRGLPGLILKIEDDEEIFQYTVIELQQYNENVKIVKDNVKYENCSLQEFNDFVKKIKSKNAISFRSGGQLYLTYRQSPLTFIDMEL